MCKRFRADRGVEAYNNYGLAELAPLVSMSLSGQRSLNLAGRVEGVPTFVLVDKHNHEIGRSVGYYGDTRKFLRTMSGMVARLERTRHARREAPAE